MPHRPHVLVADADADAARQLCRYLGSYGIAADVATDSAALRACLATYRVDLLVLDLLLPGAELPAGGQLPVIALSAQARLLDRVMGLEMGADDFLAKPVEPRELVARIRAVLRRSRGGTAAAAVPRRLLFAGWALDLQHRRLQAPDGAAVPLSDAEHRLLDIFLQHPQRVCSRGQLAVLARGQALASSGRSIDLLVSRLRHKLGDDPQAPRLIRTVRGAGYLFDARPRPG
jgi:two-component system OmpR family response regulator